MKILVILLFTVLALSRADEKKEEEKTEEAKEEESSSEIKDEKSVLVLTEKNFDSAIAENKLILVEFCK